MTRYNFPKWKIKPIGLSIDTDFDGVPNSKDCRPLNPHKQHLSKTMRERIYAQPIYLKYKATDKYMYHISDEGMPQSLKQERQKIFSIMKQRPEIIAEIERRKPKSVVYVRGGMEVGTGGFEADHHIRVRTTYPKKSKEEQHFKGHFVELGHRTPEAQAIGVVTTHELEHVRQRHAYHGKRYRKLFEGSYDEQKGERMAKQKEILMFRRRYAQPTEEELKKSRKAFMEREFD